ncbi:MAG: PKD domain-containing protein [Saprospiraceae bacterium]
MTTLGGNCDRPCTVTITNQSSANSTNFFWRFGQVSTSTDKDPAPVTFPDAGDFEIMLVAQNAEGCPDTVIKVVHVGLGISKFAKPVDVSTANVTPLNVTERGDGKFHVLYEQSGLKTVLINDLGEKDGNPANISTTNISATTSIPLNGGFVLGGENSPAAKVKFVSSAQAVAADPAGFQFNGGATSLIYGLTLNADNEIAATGSRFAAGKFTPGFARISQSGTVTLGPAIPLNDGFGGNSIAQRPDGGYLILASCQTAGCTSSCTVISVSTNGGYNSKTDLPLISYPVRIIRASGDNYAVLGYTAAGSIKALGLNASLAVSWQRDFPGVEELSDIAATPDGQLVVCGTKGSSLYFAKFPAASGSGFTWEKPFSATAATIRGLKISTAADGGYLILGVYEKNSEQDLYLVKTDAAGNTQ